jgi:hypothetical protein
VAAAVLAPVIPANLDKVINEPWKAHPGKTPRILQGPGTCKCALGRIGSALRAGQGCQEELLNY